MIVDALAVIVVALGAVIALGVVAYVVILFACLFGPSNIHTPKPPPPLEYVPPKWDR